ncbi:unnamed protein product, partial [Brassica oleracea var. botrytis]
MKRLSFPPTRLRFNGALNHSESSGSRGSGNSALDEASIRQELHDLSSCCSCCHSEFKKSFLRRRVRISKVTITSLIQSKLYL